MLRHPRLKRLIWGIQSEFVAQERKDPTKRRKFDGGRDANARAFYEETSPFSSPKIYLASYVGECGT